MLTTTLHPICQSMFWDSLQNLKIFECFGHFRRMFYLKLRNKPWINGKIQTMMCIRDQLHKKLQRNNGQSLIDLYRT